MICTENRSWILHDGWTQTQIWRGLVSWSSVSMRQPTDPSNWASCAWKFQKNLQHWLKGKSTGYSKSAWSQTCKKTCENHENPMFILVKLFLQTSLPIESSIVFHILKSLQCAEGAEFRGPGWYCKDRLDVKKTDLIVQWKKRGIWE